MVWVRNNFTFTSGGKEVQDKILEENKNDLLFFNGKFLLIMVSKLVMHQNWIH